MDRILTKDPNIKKRSGIGIISKSSLLVLGLFILSCTTVFALQSSRLVKGVVTSKEDASPIPGVVVLVKGTSQGAVTDLDGVFFH